MFCQLLFVGYKEIYWILPMGHISWCPVTKGHWNPFFSICEHFSIPKLVKKQKVSFIHFFIHSKSVYWPPSLVRHMDKKKTQIFFVFLRHSQWYVPFYESSEKEALNSFWNSCKEFYGRVEIWNPFIFIWNTKCSKINLFRF